MEFDLFDMQEIWGIILEKNKKSDDEDAEGFLEFMKKFPTEPKLEDFDFYRNYVSRFVLCKELYDKEFINDLDYSSDDIHLLLQFVAASFSSEYDLAYIPEEDKLELTIHVQSGERSMTRKLQDIWSFQIKALFLIYMEEQLHLDYYFAQDDEDSVYIEPERRDRLAIFDKKMAKCVSTAFGDSPKSIESQLDDLLNS